MNGERYCSAFPAFKCPYFISIYSWCPPLNHGLPGEAELNRNTVHVTLNYCPSWKFNYIIPDGYRWEDKRFMTLNFKPQSHYSDNQSPTSRSRQPSATISNQFPTKILVLNRSPTVCRPIAEWSTTNCQLLADWLSNILHILDLDQQPFGE